MSVIDSSETIAIIANNKRLETRSDDAKLNKLQRVIIQLLISGVILAWLLNLSDATKVWESILTVNPTYMLVAIFALIIGSMMIAFALYISLRNMGLKTQLKDAILASFGGQLLSDVTPARSGYFLTPFLLQKIDGTPVELSMTSVVTTGAMNFLVKAGLSLIALLYFVKALSLDPTLINALLIGISLLIVCGIGLMVLMLGRRISNVFKIIKKAPLLGKAMGQVVDVLNSIQDEAHRAKEAFALVGLFIFMSIFFNAVAMNFISEGLSLGPLTILDFLLIVPLISAFGFVPMTAAGLGVQEAGYVMLLTLSGTRLENATAFALIVRLLAIATDAIGLPPLLKAGLGRKP